MANETTIEAFTFGIPIQIRMSDLDPFNHVNNGIQCHYFDCGRGAYLEHVFQHPIDWSSLDLVLVHIDLDFHKPILINDHIVCETKIISVGNKSIKLIQQLRDSDTNVVKTTCHSVLVCIDRENGGSKPISEEYRRLIEKNE